MKKRILIDANFPTETRVVVLDKNNNIESFEYDNETKRQIKNNIYLAKVTRVEPSLQAAFIDYGDEKSGFLPFSEIHPDYFNIPVHDRKAHLNTLSEIKPLAVDNSETIEESASKLESSKVLDSGEVNIEEIQKLVEDKIQPDFDIDVDDSEVDFISQKHDIPDEDYKIQEVIKKGQILLVQATKEERGNKGASLTTYISLAGKYCVLMPNKASQNGISRKIANNDERKRLKNIVSNLTSDNNNASIIIRTAGAGHSSIDIKRDFEYLSKLWNKIREATLKATAPSFIHQEDSIMLKSVRDLLDKNVKEVLVQGRQAFNDCIRYVSDMMPNERSIVKEYKSKTPIFTKFQVEEQLTKLYQTNVHLPSGGYIVINPTEALISIDVNSGKSTQERSIEEMALKTNIEAAREIATQVRLRDLSGLLVLDFIDMGSNKNRKIVERTLREFMSKDKARIQLTPISTFGLLEMSRQRLRPSFLEVNSIMCSHCNGKGVIRADEPNSMLILRTIENEIFNSSYDVVNIYGIASSIIYLLNNKRAEIEFVEQKYNIKLNFYIDKDATSDSYSIEKVRASDKKKTKEIKSSQVPILQDTSNIYAESDNISKSRKKIDSKNHNRKNAEEKSNQRELDDDDKKKRIPRKNKKQVVQKEDSIENTSAKKDSQTNELNALNSSDIEKANVRTIATDSTKTEANKETTTKKRPSRKKAANTKKAKDSKGSNKEDYSGEVNRPNNEKNPSVASEVISSALGEGDTKLPNNNNSNSKAKYSKSSGVSSKKRIAKKAASKAIKKKEITSTEEPNITEA